MVTQEHTRHTPHLLVRLTASLLGAAFALVILVSLIELLDTLSLAFPLFFLASGLILPLIAGVAAVRIPPPRVGRILTAGGVAGLLPGLAGIWFELHTLGEPFSIDTLRWPVIGTGLGVLVAILLVRRQRTRAA